MKNEKMILLVDIWIQVILISVAVWFMILEYNYSFALSLIPYQALISANFHIIDRKYIRKEIYQKRKIHLRIFWGFIMLVMIITIMSEAIFPAIENSEIITFLVFLTLFQFGLCIYYFIISIQDYKS